MMVKVFTFWTVIYPNLFKVSMALAAVPDEDVPEEISAVSFWSKNSLIWYMAFCGLPLMRCG